MESYLNEKKKIGKIVPQTLEKKNENNNATRTIKHAWIDISELWWRWKPEMRSAGWGVGEGELWREQRGMRKRVDGIR